MRKTKCKFLKLTNHIKVCFSFQHFNFPNEMNFSFLYDEYSIENSKRQLPGKKVSFEAQNHNLSLNVENLHDFFSLFANRSQ